MPFEKIAVSRGTGRGGSRKVDTPQIAFYHNVGSFRFNRAALDALGNPDSVAILHDADTNRIAVVPDPEGASFRKEDKSGSKMLSYGSFAAIAESAAPGVAKVRGTLVQDQESGYWVSDFLNTQSAPEATDATDATADDASDSGVVESATGGRRARR